MKAMIYNSPFVTRRIFKKEYFLFVGALCCAISSKLIAETTINAESKAQPFIPSSTLRAQPSFFGRHAEGWHWYSLNENSMKEDKIKGETRPSPKTPTEVIEGQRKVIETKLHAAIVEPTRENIISYILAQRALMDQSQRFSESWKRVVMTTPSLDETLNHPVDQNARHIYYGEQNEKTREQIKKLAGEFGLYYFFRQNCPYCHGFAPLVKSFAQKYGWSVLAISLDGGRLKEFPQAKQDNGMAERLKITHVPALIALHPKSGQLIPLAYGMISESEIDARVKFLTRGPLSEKTVVQKGELR